MHLLRRAAIVAGLLFSSGLAVIYLSNLQLLHRTYPLAPITLAADLAPDAAERGKRLADVTGCTDCHGVDLRGKTFIDEGWWRGRYYSSNLTLKVQEYSDEELARIVREGVRPDGRGVIAMPAKVNPPVMSAIGSRCTRRAAAPRAAASSSSCSAGPATSATSSAGRTITSRSTTRPTAR